MVFNFLNIATNLWIAAMIHETNHTDANSESTYSHGHASSRKCRKCRLIVRHQSEKFILIEPN